MQHRKQIKDSSFLPLLNINNENNKLKELKITETFSKATCFPLQQLK